MDGLVESVLEPVLESVPLFGLPLMSSPELAEPEGEVLVESEDVLEPEVLPDVEPPIVPELEPVESVEPGALVLGAVVLGELVEELLPAVPSLITSSRWTLSASPEPEKLART